MLTNGDVWFSYLKEITVTVRGHVNLRVKPWTCADDLQVWWLQGSPREVLCVSAVSGLDLNSCGQKAHETVARARFVCEKIVGVQCSEHFWKTRMMRSEKNARD